MAERRRGFLRQAGQAATEVRGVPLPRRTPGAINRFIEEANANPRPFRWIKDPDSIIAAVRRGYQALG